MEKEERFHGDKRYQAEKRVDTPKNQNKEPKNVRISQ